MRTLGTRKENDTTYHIIEVTDAELAQMQSGDIPTGNVRDTDEFRLQFQSDLAAWNVRVNLPERLKNALIRNSILRPHAFLSSDGDGFMTLRCFLETLSDRRGGYGGKGDARAFASKLIGIGDKGIQELLEAIGRGLP